MRPDKFTQKMQEASQFNQQEITNGSNWCGPSRRRNVMAAKIRVANRRHR
jgi:hypothetical protein